MTTWTSELRILASQMLVLHDAKGHVCASFIFRTPNRYEESHSFGERLGITCTLHPHEHGHVKVLGEGRRA